MIFIHRPDPQLNINLNIMVTPAGLIPEPSDIPKDQSCLLCFAVVQSFFQTGFHQHPHHVCQSPCSNGIGDS